MLNKSFYAVNNLIFNFLLHISAQNYLIHQNQSSEERAGYYFNFNQGTKVCNWVSYTLISEDFKGAEVPLRKFHKDLIT